MNPADKPRLSDAEKKQNHIVSEQKRRQAIREGFDRLAEIVPGMEGQGRSEAVVLQATVDHLRAELEKKGHFKTRAMEERGITEEQLETMYQSARDGKAGQIFGIAGSVKQEGV